MERKMIWVLLFVGSTLGSLIPLLWGENSLSLSSIIFTAIGGFFGIWLGFKMSQ